MMNSRLKIDDAYYGQVASMIQNGGMAPTLSAQAPQGAMPQMGGMMPQDASMGLPGGAGPMPIEQILAASGEMAGLPQPMRQAMGAF